MKQIYQGGIRGSDA